jgi:hypothetical protein
VRGDAGFVAEASQAFHKRCVELEFEMGTAVGEGLGPGSIRGELQGIEAAEVLTPVVQ